jgi:hypothetical protein
MVAVPSEDHRLRGICCHGVFPRATGRLNQVLCPNWWPALASGIAQNRMRLGVLATGGTDDR